MQGKICTGQKLDRARQSSRSEDKILNAADTKLPRKTKNAGRPRTLEDQKHWKTKNTGRPKTTQDKDKHRHHRIQAQAPQKTKQKPNTLENKNPREPNKSFN